MNGQQRIKTYKTFQHEAVDSGVALFSAEKEMLDVADAGRDAGGRARVIGHNGYLLIEAPNAWEEQFAKFLDSAPGDTILWWHRNPVNQDWSVNVLRDSGRDFYPDFIVGVKGRNTLQNVLLVETKYNFTDEKESEKVLAEHKSYGRAMVLTLHLNRWLVVSWDSKRNKPVAETEFRIADMAGF